MEVGYPFLRLKFKISQSSYEKMCDLKVESSRDSLDKKKPPSFPKSRSQNVDSVLKLNKVPTTFYQEILSMNIYTKIQSMSITFHVKFVGVKWFIPLCWVSGVTFFR